MKTLFKRTILFILLTPFLIISCETDEAENPQVIYLMITERGSGTVFFIDTETGELEEFTTFSIGDEDITGIRSMAYNSATNRVYAGQVSNASGSVYELNMANRSATLINDNQDGMGNAEWYGIADITVQEDGIMKMTTWDRNPEFPGILTMNSDGSVQDPFLAFDTFTPGEGLALTWYNGAYLIGEYAEFHEVSLDGDVTATIGLSGVFPPEVDPDESYVQNFTWINETLYALLYDASSGNSLVCSLDPTTGEADPIVVILGRASGLAAIPDIAFR